MARRCVLVLVDASSDIHELRVEARIEITGPTYSIEDQHKHRLATALGEILEREVTKLLTQNNFVVKVQ